MRYDLSFLTREFLPACIRRDARAVLSLYRAGAAIRIPPAEEMHSRIGNYLYGNKKTGKRLPGS
ncbi:MAG: hypothetical protein LLG37_01680 [Spirochaetia bacterium]|nr:hypothetical protein [Spirochaetia bacterium]